MRLKLQGYDLKIVHTPGEENLSADALSRNPVPSDALAITRNMTKNKDQNCAVPPNKNTVIPRQGTTPTIEVPKKQGRPKKITTKLTFVFLEKKLLSLFV